MMAGKTDASCTITIQKTLEHELRNAATRRGRTFESVLESCIEGGLEQLSWEEMADALTGETSPVDRSDPEEGGCMTNDYPTVTLRNGVTVLAKLHNGELRSLMYANRTQAEAKIKMMPKNWYVYKGVGRPFYVAQVRT